LDAPGLDAPGLGVVLVPVVDEEPDEGFVAGVVEVGVEVEVDVVGEGVVAVPVDAGAVAVAGGQDWETLVIGRLTGSGSELGGVPGGTFANVKACPPATVTVTVQPSAEALGSAASPSTATVDPKATAATLSFRVLNKVAYSSRKVPLANSSELQSQVGLIRTLPAAGDLCNWEPSVWSLSVRVPDVTSSLTERPCHPLDRQEPPATVAVSGHRRSGNPRVEGEIPSI
jgi:hypothetical protein